MVTCSATADDAWVTWGTCLVFQGMSYWSDEVMVLRHEDFRTGWSYVLALILCDKDVVTRGADNAFVTGVHKQECI